MKIDFWLTTPKQFDPSKVDETPFGGAEMSAIHLARELSKNNDVSICANIAQPSKFDGDIFWHHYGSLKDFAGTLDVLIVVRADQNLLNPRRNHVYFGQNKPRRIILWTGDAYDQPNNQILHDTFALRDIDLIVAKSSWQRKTLLQHFPLLNSNKIEWIYNGVPNDIPESTYPKEPRFVYASTAYRGLHNFLDIWPRVKERIPDATLDCYCKTTLYIDNNPRDAQFYDLYAQLQSMDGITIKEPLPQKAFHKELTQYRVMLYPNSDFLESSCGVALEAMAIGIPVIATARAGLVETIQMGNGRLIDDDPSSETYANHFCKMIDMVYYSNHIRKNLLTKYSWSKVAKRWQELLNRVVHQTMEHQEICRESSLAFSRVQA